VLFISFILLMAAASSSDVSKSIFTNYVTSSLSTEKLMVLITIVGPLISNYGFI
jgi:hypothetical protein